MPMDDESRELNELVDMIEFVYEAAERSLSLRDMETHFIYGATYHKLCTKWERLTN